MTILDAKFWASLRDLHVTNNGDLSQVLLSTIDRAAPVMVNNPAIVAVLPIIRKAA